MKKERSMFYFIGRKISVASFVIVTSLFISVCGGAQVSEGTMVQSLLSNNVSERETSLDRAMSLANQGKLDGVVAIVEAIRTLAGNPSLTFPKFRRGVQFTLQEAQAAENQIIHLLRSNSFLNDMSKAKHLLLMYGRINNGDINPLGEKVDKAMGESAFQRLQLVHAYFKIAARLRKVTGSDILPGQALE